MKLFMFICTCLLSGTLLAQKAKKPEIYLWNASFQAAKSQTEVYFMTEVSMINDTCWQWDTYHISGPLYSSEQFKDHDGKKPHGRFARYKGHGYIDSTGYCSNGLLDGDWLYYNDMGDLITKKKYNKGILISVEENLKEPDDNLLEGEVESEFPGGLGQWQKYLIKKMKYPERAETLKKAGIVAVNFRVNADGSLDDIYIFRSVEYSLDKEALRMIRTSPKWTPGKKDGKYVVTYKRQPIEFALLEEE